MRKKEKTTFYFLILFNSQLERIEEQQCFSDEREALDKYARLEQKHRENSDREVVLIRADSINTVRKTHSRYFGGSRSKADPFPPIVRSGKSS